MTLADIAIRPAPPTLRRKVVLTRGPLVSTRRALNNEATPAIGLAYLAGCALKHGYDVSLVDPIGAGLNQVWEIPEFPGYVGHGLRFQELVEQIPSDVDVIGFSIMFSGEWPVQRLLLKELRRHFPRALIVAGGEHITALTEYSLQECPEIDLCVRGEGERTFLEVLDRYSRGEDPRQTVGVGYLEGGGRFVLNGDKPPRVRDIDTIPWPHWPDGYLDKFWEAGKSFGTQVGRDMPIVVSRGCPYQCTFCSSPQMWTTRYVLREIGDVVAEIKHNMTRFKIDSLQFYDLTAITKRRWTLEFCQRLHDEGIHLAWSLPSGTRSEALDPEILALLKQTGCSYLVYAPESGAPTTLARIKKRIDLGALSQSALEARRLGITVRINLIIGFPGESRSEILQTILYGIKMAALGIDEVPINIYSAYPGSELFSDLTQSGRVSLGDRYFLSLTSLNADFTSLQPMTMNEHLSVRELALYRVMAMAFNYLLGYIVRPQRIIRTLWNVLGGGSGAATVLEHRLKDAMRRRGNSKLLGSDGVAPAGGRGSQ